MRVSLQPLFRWVMLVGSLAVLPNAAFAQTGAIAGQVTDTTGAVLPGVTVEASSPALIAGTRTVITDGGGRYAVEQLVPGDYTVKFTLSGFSTLIREGIELSANFTAPVSVQLRVGALEESVTVAGASPVVDVARTDSQTVLTRDALEALPTGRGWAQAGVLIPGVVAGATDVGGSSGMHQQYLSIHGSLSTDSTPLVDGMSVATMFATGYVVSNYLDDGAFQETVFITGGGTAEVQSGGIAMNLVPKEGGNKFSGQGVNLYSDSNLASSNYTDELKARGLVIPSSLVKDWDYGWSLGGPIRESKLWFFGAYRNWGVNTTVSNTFDEQGNQGVDDNLLQSMLLRLTYQANQKNKFAAFYTRNPRWRGHRNLAPGVDPKATVINDTFAPYDAQAKWTSTVTSKLLVEAGFSMPIHAYGLPYQASVRPTDVPKRDTILGTLWNAACCGPQVANSFSYFHAENEMASASYVTGTHSIKVGVQHKHGYVKVLTLQNGDLVQEYQRGVPYQVTVANTPNDTRTDLNHDLGLFAQDAWRVHRLTLNTGIRFDYLRASVPVQTSAAGRFVPARSFPELDNMPRWTDWSPRLGVAYDLFGDAKTALKFSAGKYVGQESVGFATRYNPLTYQSDPRTWNDVNRDDIAQDSEIGPSRNSAFGLAAGTNTPDPDIKRPYNVMYEIEGQREILPRVSLGVGYYHRKYYNVSWTQNLATTFGDYTLIEIPDPRGNGKVVPVYNLNPAKLGQVRNFDTTSENNTTIFNGFNASVAMRFNRGLSLRAGLDAGKSEAITCDVADPNNLLFCDQTAFNVPYRTQYKLSGSYPLPWAGIAFSGVFQSVPGAIRGTAALPGITYLITRAVVPQLTVSSINKVISEPGTAYYPRNNQLDLKASKTFTYRAVRIMPEVEVFNATNTATITSQINTIGPTLDNVRAILFQRFVRFGVQVNF